MRITPAILLTPLLALTLACSLGSLTQSATPKPTQVPTARELIYTLQRAGLEVADVQALDSSNSPLLGEVENLKFYTPSLCDGCSSLVIIFDSEASALTARGMIQRAGETNDAFKFHLYQNGRVLLRMGGLIDKGQADKYAQAMHLE